jgi:hypothetical protein
MGKLPPWLSLHDRAATGPGERSDGVVVFERPAFKESSERLELRLAQADRVDHPILLPLPFITMGKGGSR